MSAQWIGFIPEHIKDKAQRALKQIENRPGIGWKKLRRLQNCYSFKLNHKFRMLWLQGDQIVICNHDTYENRINSSR